VSGVSGLFTSEFYGHVSAHLAPDGHFVQWLQLYEMSPQTAGSILRAFSAVFPVYRAYLTNNFDVVLVARNDAKMPELQPAALDGMQQLQGHLLRVGLTSASMVAALDAGRGNAIQLLANSFRSPPNSDFFPYVDHHAAGDRFRRDTARQLFALREAPVPLLDFAPDAKPMTNPIAVATRHMPDYVSFMAAGQQGLRYLQGQRLTPEDMAQFSWLQLEYAAVRAWAGSCNFPAGTGAPWQAMVRVAASINPAVPAKDASAWWTSVATRCRNTLSAPQRAWVDLFAATGARDADASGRRADSVLAIDTQFTQETRAYAALASVAGNTSALRRDHASDVLKTQAAKLRHDQLDMPWFRYLNQSLTIRAKPPAAQP
jgi:hypothetical protein